jgi:hypothetical protein
MMNDCEEHRLFADEVITLRELLALVHPLCRNQATRTIPDLAEDILAPAQQCDDTEQLELTRLCSVFSLVLEYLARAVLCDLAEYLAGFESARTLKRFLTSVTELSSTLSDAYEESVLDAFACTLSRELVDEPF